MRNPSDRVLRTSFTACWNQEWSQILAVLSCCAAVLSLEKESGQNGTGSVTNNMRLKQSYCHQRVPVIWQEQNEKSMTEKMNTSSSPDPERIPVYQAKRHRQRQCPAQPEESSPVWRIQRQHPAQFATLVRRAVEKSHLRAWLSPAAWQVGTKVFADKIQGQFGPLNICQREKGVQDHHWHPFSPLL